MVLDERRFVCRSRLRMFSSMIKAIKKIRPARVVLYCVMIGLVLFTALPLIYMVATAFKPMQELFLFPPTFFVENPTTRNFYDLFVVMGTSTVPYIRYIFNSVLVTVITVFLTVHVSACGAYGLVKFDIPGGKWIFSVVVAALMFSSHVTQIPRYMVVNTLNLIDTYAALILPCIAVAYNFFLMKQFIEQFPDTLIEAGRIDGAGEFRIFFKLVFPALAAPMATLVVFSFITTWNDYFTPLVYITSASMKTLPLALQTLSGGVGAASLSRAGAVAAATLVMTLPPILIFSVMQRKVIAALTYSGIKG